MEEKTLKSEADFISVLLEVSAELMKRAKKGYPPCQILISPGSLTLEKYAKKRQELIMSRFLLKKSLKQYEALLGQMDPPEKDLPTEEVSIKAATKELIRIGSLNQQIRQAKRYRDTERLINNVTDELDTINDKLDGLDIDAMDIPQ